MEKYLKARLEEAAVPFPKTHDLERLLDLAITVEPLWASLRPAMAAITDYAVEVRYPGRTTSPAEARILLQATMRIRKLIRPTLGLH